MNQGLAIAIIFSAPLLLPAPPAVERLQTISPDTAARTSIHADTALQKAGRLRAEARAHREMENHFRNLRAVSPRDRYWNTSVVRLCREYARDAEAAAAAYEALVVRPASTESTEGDTRPTEQAIEAPPSTAHEYRARSVEYEARAADFRADADRHAAMIDRTPLTPSTQPYREGLPPQRPVVFESAAIRDMRDHCIEIVRRSNALAREADEIAKHYALRAKQLEGK